MPKHGQSSEISTPKPGCVVSCRGRKFAQFLLAVRERLGHATLRAPKYYRLQNLRAQLLRVTSRIITKQCDQVYRYIVL